MRFTCDGHADLNRGDEGVVETDSAVPGMIDVRWHALGKVVTVKLACVELAAGTAKR